MVSCNIMVAMAAGESVPVMKTPLPQVEEAFNPDKYKRHTLFGGTHVIQTRFYSNTPVLAVVVRTDGLYLRCNPAMLLCYLLLQDLPHPKEPQGRRSRGGWGG